MRFDHDLPTRIVFGPGRLDELGGQVRGLGVCALLVTGRSSMRASGVLDRAVATLRGAGVHVVVHDDVSANPRSNEVDAGAATARRHSCDVVVGLGGGSALDAAKAIAVAVPHGPVGPMIGKTLDHDPDALPIVAVPTTAGTGSEVSRGAIIIDVERRFKSGLRGPDLFPRVALVDPDLTATMPATLAAETGFDALTHCIESYLARGSTPVTDLMALRAAELLGTHLVRVADGDVTDAVRSDLCLAALFGGLNVATAGTCLPHRLQQAMGSDMSIGVAHARGLAAVYPAWLREVEPFAESRLEVLASHLGHGPLRDAVPALLERLDLATSLGTVGYRPGAVDRFLQSVSGNLGNDPIEGIDEALLRRLFEAAW